MKIERKSVNSELKDAGKVLATFAVLVGSALLSYYLFVIVVTFTGQWQNNLTNGPVIGISVAIFLIQSVIGFGLRRPLPIGFVFAALWFVGGLASILHRKPLANWVFWWPSALQYPVGSILNALSVVALVYWLKLPLSERLSARGHRVGK